MIVKGLKLRNTRMQQVFSGAKCLALIRGGTYLTCGTGRLCVASNCDIQVPFILLCLGMPEPAWKDLVFFFPLNLVV